MLSPKTTALISRTKAFPDRSSVLLFFLDGKYSIQRIMLFEDEIVMQELWSLQPVKILSKKEMEHLEKNLVGEVIEITSTFI